MTNEILRSIIIMGDSFQNYINHLDSFIEQYNVVSISDHHKGEDGYYSSLVFYYDHKKQDDKSKYILCNRCENIEESLVSWIDKPVYVKGYCWAKEFDGWTVLYLDEKKERDWLGHLNLWFDYRGKKYPVYGFLPSGLETDSNAIYTCKV